MNADRPNPPYPGETSKFTCNFCGAVFETERSYASTKKLRR